VTRRSRRNRSTAGDVRMRPACRRAQLRPAGDVEPGHQRRIRGPQSAHLRAVVLLSQAWHHQVFKLGRRIVAALTGSRARARELAKAAKGDFKAVSSAAFPAGGRGGFDGPLFEQPEGPMPVKTTDRPDAVTRKKVLGTVRSPKRRTGRNYRAAAPLPTTPPDQKNNYDS
jgi:hypothetical protein